MEKVIGVDQIRPRLGEYVNRAEKGEVWVITSRSMPKGVLIGYSRYEELKRLAERARLLEVSAGPINDGSWVNGLVRSSSCESDILVPLHDPLQRPVRLLSEPLNDL
ncbi:MAG TPA: type II toxin-antitoxin system prevent-host-death family antitoxin [Firmicutes bacterium]|nr:type II toxin-antitoxin system prevent-host-death family antitoxin [Candidatus Fermentithermobacillaceae bacterium]